MKVFSPAQQDAYNNLRKSHIGGALMDMGLGKTGVGLRLALTDPKPILLVGPIPVIKSVWEQEARTWEETKHLTFGLYRGTKAERAKVASQAKDIYMVNPEMLEEALKELPKCNSLYVDESSMFKNPSTKRFKHLKKSLSSFTARRIFTGTPTPNSMMDIWSQIFLLDGGVRLGTSFYGFRDRFFEQADYMGYVFRPRERAKEKIASLISDITVRIRYEDYLDPSEVVDNVIPVDLEPKTRKLYEDMEKKAIAELNGETLTAGSAVVVLNKLRQVTGGFVFNDVRESRLLHTEKLEALDQVIESAPSPVIVIYNYIPEKEMLQSRYKQLKVYEPGMEDDWNAGKIPVMALHPRSGGHGLNLQFGGHIMVFYSLSFSWEEIQQVKKRIDRRGQSKPVVYHYLIVKDSVDELMLQVQSRKGEAQQDFLELVKAYTKGKKHG